MNWYSHSVLLSGQGSAYNIVPVVKLGDWYNKMILAAGSYESKVEGGLLWVRPSQWSSDKNVWRNDTQQLRSDFGFSYPFKAPDRKWWQTRDMSTIDNNAVQQLQSIGINIQDVGQQPAPIQDQVSQ